MTPLKYLAQINPSTPAFDRLSSDEEVGFVPLEAVWRHGVDASQRRSKEAVATGYTRFIDGDIILPKITPTFQADRTAIVAGVAGGVAAGTTELHVVRVSPASDVRFIRYVLSSRQFLHGGAAEMIGVAGQKRVPDSWLRDFPVHVKALSEQRAIADYLDTETARIDALIGRKQRLDTLLAERRDALVADAFNAYGINLHHAMASHAPLPDGWRRTTLGRVLTQLTNGYVGPTRDILVESGVQYIQGMHIKGGRIAFERRPFFVSEDWHRARPRISLSAGDILIVQTGDIGRVAVVPDDLGPASCHALLIARPKRDLVSSAYLGMYLQSSSGWHEMLRLATGALHPHLEFGIKAVPVLVPPKSEQHDLVVEIRNRQRQLDLTRSKLARQVELLQEHRQALITAAVTGELEIPGEVS